MSEVLETQQRTWVLTQTPAGSNLTEGHRLRSQSRYDTLLQGSREEAPVFLWEPSVGTTEDSFKEVQECSLTFIRARRHRLICVVVPCGFSHLQRLVWIPGARGDAEGQSLGSESWLILGSRAIFNRQQISTTSACSLRPPFSIMQDTYLYVDIT